MVVILFLPNQVQLAHPMPLPLRALIMYSTWVQVLPMQGRSIMMPNFQRMECFGTVQKLVIVE